MEHQQTDIARFERLKQKADDLKSKRAELLGQKKAAEDQYNMLLEELKQFGVQTVEELEAKIQALGVEVSAYLVTAEKEMEVAEMTLKGINEQLRGK